MAVLVTKRCSVDVRSSNVCRCLILLGEKLLGLSETSFNLLLLLHSHIRKVLPSRSTLILLLHPLHLLLLSHLLLFLRHVARHFSLFAHAVRLLEVDLRILTLEVLCREVVVLGLLRCTWRWSSILHSLKATQIGAYMQSGLRSSLILLMERYLMIKLLQDELRIVQDIALFFLLVLLSLVFGLNTCIDNSLILGKSCKLVIVVISIEKGLYRGSS